MKETLFGLLLVAFLCLILVIPFTGAYSNYSNGERTGDIYKFSKKGLIWKSWEGEMYLGGYHSSGGKQPVIETDRFYFSIAGENEQQKQDVIEKISQCSQNRDKQCTIHYRQWFIGPARIDSTYEVQDVTSN